MKIAKALVFHKGRLYAQYLCDKNAPQKRPYKCRYCDIRRHTSICPCNDNNEPVCFSIRGESYILKEILISQIWNATFDVLFEKNVLAEGATP